MKTLSAALTTEHTESSVEPYVKFKLTSSEWFLNSYPSDTNRGVATGAPILLSNGNNTVTITTAGTFHITIPTGVTGTVTSGTATVTGSPVTLTEGVNDIAVTTTGTITVAVTEVTYDYSIDQSNPVIWLEHHEEDYNDYATVVLDNHDKTISEDLRGYWVQIAYGYITGNAVADSEGAESAGNNSTAEYSYTPRMWVTQLAGYSTPGKSYMILQLDGMWSKLKDVQWMDTTATELADLYYKIYNWDEDLGEVDPTYTIEDMLGFVLAKYGFTVSIGTSDSIVDNVNINPPFSINYADAQESFNYLATLVYRLVQMTKGYLRPKTGLDFEFVYPQSSDSVDRTFYSDQQPYFYEYMERYNALTPNHIYILWGWNELDQDWDATITTLGEAIDNDEVEQNGEIPRIYRAEGITSETDADTRADVLLTRALAERMSGHLIVRHDCALELYDRVEVQDIRGLSV